MALSHRSLQKANILNTCLIIIIILEEFSDIIVRKFFQNDNETQITILYTQPNKTKDGVMQIIPKS